MGSIMVPVTLSVMSEALEVVPAAADTNSDTGVVLPASSVSCVMGKVALQLTHSSG
jgi:hypothetical protein